MKNLFEGFAWAHGTDEGGCKWAEVTDDLFGRHIQGTEMIGIYPMVYDPEEETVGQGGYTKDPKGRRYYESMNPDLWKCLWGAIDIDEGNDSMIHAENASIILEAMGVTAWVELSRSKGCHVWVFMEDWVSPTTMRQALTAALQLGKVPYDAVYPKQESLDGPPGNYMRLPYGGKRPKGRQEVYLDGYPMEYHDFVIEAERTRVTLDALEEAAGFYEEPVSNLPPVREYSKEPLMKVDGMRLRGVAKRMYENGPVSYYTENEGAGRGRHGFLNRFARAMWEAGYDNSAILRWTQDLDSKLGSWWEEGPKFEGRRDADRQLRHLIEAARTQATIR